MINKGDIVKTSISDNTLVLAAEKDKALLFAEDKFVIAHGIQMAGDHVFWGQGECYDELPVDVFNQGPEDNMREFIDNNYEKLVKTLISMEVEINDEDTIDRIYDKFLKNDVNLINDYFGEVADTVLSEEDSWGLEL